MVKKILAAAAAATFGLLMIAAPAMAGQGKGANTNGPILCCYE